MKSLRSAGLKVTLPRVKILQLLESAASRHMTAEEIHRLLTLSGDDVGLATVYRVLTQFEEVSLVKRHHFESGSSVFELNRGGHHDHLVCIKCGQVEEFVDDVIEQRQMSIAEKAGYTITDHSLNIYGVCAPCDLHDRIVD